MITEHEVFYVKVASDGGQIVSFYAEDVEKGTGEVRFFNCQVLVSVGRPQFGVGLLGMRTVRNNDANTVVFVTPHPMPAWFKKFGEEMKNVEAGVLYR